jgi:hypothetical protein
MRTGFSRLRAIPACTAPRFEHQRTKVLVSGVEGIQRRLEQLALDLGVLTDIPELSTLLLLQAIVLALGCREQADALTDRIHRRARRTAGSRCVDTVPRARHDAPL